MLVFVLRDLYFNLALMTIASVLILMSGVKWLRRVATILGIWILGALMTHSLSGVVSPALRYTHGYLGSAAITGTAVSAVLGMALLTGIANSPTALVRSVTRVFRLPYRIGVAGTASVTFVTLFQRDLTLLRTARALRGVGKRWGILGPAIRWATSVVPLIITAIQHGERVALSMDARALGAYRSRTELQTEPWRLRDSAVVAGSWIASAVATWWLSH